MALPPRDWFSLDQAAEKLTRDTGETVTAGDLLYYANRGQLELSVYIDFNLVFFDDYKDEALSGYLDIRNSNINNELLDKTSYIVIKSWQLPPHKNFIKGELFTAIVRDEFDLAEYRDKIKKECEENDLLFVDSDLGIEEANKKLRFYDSVYFDTKKISHDEHLSKEEIIYMDIKTNVDKLRGFFVIDFEDFESLLIDENNPVLNLKDLSFRPARSDNIDGFGFYIEGYGFNAFSNQIFEINKNSMFVTKHELDLLAKGGKKIRSLNTFESVIEELKDPSRLLQPKKIKKEIVELETETIKMFRFVDEDIEESTEESKEDYELQEENLKNWLENSRKNKDKPKQFYKRIIVLSSFKTLQKYPESGLETIVKAVINAVSNDYGVKGNVMPSLRTCTDKLKDLGVRRERKSGRKTEKINVIIKTEL